MMYPKSLSFLKFMTNSLSWLIYLTPNFCMLTQAHSDADFC